MLIILIYRSIKEFFFKLKKYKKQSNPSMVDIQHYQFVLDKLVCNAL